MQANLQELKETYSRQTYSVFSINRQQKIADSQVTFSLAHSVFIIPVFGSGVKEPQLYTLLQVRP